MSEKPDRRQVRTQQLMRQALIELIEEKGIESITVTDVTNRADINRGTFYLHYRDVSDMLQQLKDEMFENFRQIMLQLDLKEAIHYATKDMAYPKSALLFEEISRHAHFYRVILGPKGDLSYAIRMKELIKTNLYNKLSYTPTDQQKPLVPIEYLIAFMSSANLGVVLHWLETGMRQTPQEMSLIMTRILSNGLLAATGLMDTFTLS